MKEIISLGVGGCGINLTDNFFREIATEHRIDINGTPIDGIGDMHHMPSVFFDECQSGKYIPRSLLIDSDNHNVD